MTGDPSPSPFERATAALRALGIVLARLPGEYRVNYRNGADATARMAETLDEAIELGRSMAADAPAPTGPAKGKRRRKIKAHNYRLCARTLKKQRKDE